MEMKFIKIHFSFAAAARNVRQQEFEVANLARKLVLFFFGYKNIQVKREKRNSSFFKNVTECKCIQKREESHYFGII